MTCSHFEVVMQIKYRSKGFSRIRVHFMQGERERERVGCGGFKRLILLFTEKKTLALGP